MVLLSFAFIDEGGKTVEEFSMEQSDFDIQKEEDRNKNTKMPRIIQVGALYSLAVILMVLYPQDCKQHWGSISEGSFGSSSYNAASVAFFDIVQV